MSGLGIPELLIVVTIALLLFGVGRIGKLASELGGAIRGFTESIKQDNPNERSD
jgi:sec-independent protein translocase protein TatA